MFKICFTLTLYICTHCFFLGTDCYSSVLQIETTVCAIFRPVNLHFPSFSYCEVLATIVIKRKKKKNLKAGGEMVQEDVASV